MVRIDVLKELREETGHSIAKCKEALEESGGDLEKARSILRERGSVVMRTKADRDLGAGVIQSYIHTTNRVGTMVELLCETDFVARNEEFIALARDIAIHCAAFQPVYRTRDMVAEDVMQRVMSELEEQVGDVPGSARDNALAGMLDAKMREVVLEEQAFLKDDTRTIKNLVEEAVQKFGERMEIGRFVVWVL